MAKKTPTWVWVVVGVIAFCVLALVVVVGGGIYMFRQHVQTESASTQDVQKEFEQARQRFVGKQPLVEVPKSDSDDRQVVVHKPPDTAERTNLKSIRVLAYDPRQGRVVRVDVPVWLARMSMSGPGGSGRRRITVNGEDIEFDAGNLTFEDVERHGPGLIVDTGDGRGGQVLVWAE